MMVNTMKTKAIYFDLDGTVADLYNTPGWLYAVENAKPIFENLAPIYDMEQLANVCHDLQKQGWIIGVITHLPMRATQYGADLATSEKLTWVKKHMPYVQEMYCQAYGINKMLAPRVRHDEMVLIDDNPKVRAMWIESQGSTIDPTKGKLIEDLKSLLK